MNELPIEIQKLAARYKPIETDGLILYPIVVKHYDEFLMARPALEVMHQSLPVALMRMPLLSALYQMDFSATLLGQPKTGLFSRALTVLQLSMRLRDGAQKDWENPFEILIDPEEPSKLVGLRFVDNRGTQKTILPAQYATLRQIIAAQNGVKIESEKANPDIVKAAKDKASSGSPELDVNVEDWISAVSALTGTPEEEIDEWPILKFQRRSQSFQRLIDYMICGVGECSGMVSWPKGNPHPHPFFNRIADNGILSELGGTSDGSKQTPPTAAESIREISKKL